MSPVVLVLGLVLFSVLYMRARLGVAETAAKRLDVVEHAAMHSTGMVRNSMAVTLQDAGSPEQLEAYERLVQQDALLTMQSDLI